MARRRKQRKSRTATTPRIRRREIQLDELKAILERAKAGPLCDDDHGTLASAVDTLAVLTQELEAKGASIRRLRKLIFGASTEKTSDVLGDDGAEQPDEPTGADEPDEEPADADADADEPGQDATEISDDEKKTKRPGHGRNGASNYTGAEKKTVSHGSLKHKERCPCCEKGKVYAQREPKVLVRVAGMAPLSATVYELDRLRCNLCGEVFTADAPEGVGEEKYDETAASMIALLKYGCGMPFHRLDRLQDSLGIPLPSSTQWEVVEKAAGLLDPAYQELIRQAAQGEVLHNDDTTMKILDLPPMGVEGKSDRTGVYTTGIVSVSEEQQIALFFTGHQHAGENLADVLARRSSELGPPIQMSDALSHNTAGEFESIVANCIPHSRRKFVDVVDNFPDECRVVLVALRDVFRFDAEAKKLGLSPEERLRFHQDRSGPVLDGLKTWLQEQFDKRKVEPNSGLGEAIKYMQKHWKKLTLFLHVPGAPLSNNICERALKKAVLHRKNAYFYKTEKGAYVGDLFMSLIHTVELCSANPFDYLVALQRHHTEVTQNPGAWMPWNFHDSLARLAVAHAPPS